MRNRYNVQPGDRYNDWTVIGYARGSKTPVQVRCICGFETYVQADCLVNDRSKRCRDCSRKIFAKSRCKEPGYAMRTRVYTQYSSAAKRRGIEFTLTKDEFYPLITENCFYCGDAPKNVMKMTGSNGEFVYTGLDRVDNSVGYCIGNVVPCCKVCNYMKHELDKAEFLRHIRKILDSLERGSND